MLVSTKGTGLIKVVFVETTAENPACMSGKGIMDVYPGRLFYNTFVGFVRVDVHLAKHQFIYEAMSVPVDIVYIKYERYLNPAGAHASSSDSSENAVQYKATTHPLEQITKHETVKKEDHETLRKVLNKD